MSILRLIMMLNRISLSEKLKINEDERMTSCKSEYGEDIFKYMITEGVNADFEIKKEKDRVGERERDRKT